MSYRFNGRQKPFWSNGPRRRVYSICFVIFFYHGIRSRPDVLLDPIDIRLTDHELRTVEIRADGLENKVIECSLLISERFLFDIRLIRSGSDGFDGEWLIPEVFNLVV